MQTARLTRPDRILWCDGSEIEYKTLCAELIRSGTFTPLNHEKRPRSFAARSDPGCRHAIGKGSAGKIAGKRSQASRMMDRAPRSQSS
jgi:GTP-dependent phosphoenolpyruvate carboxykinase